ncbi:hypothetical protein Q9Q94_07350 [Uliginosibacterium sp. 31-16]|uniref:hypothetical protein n=1 Tax=Uliginosibacterium sp. 31-16 TaxID=3068315 RepID=UPI00273EEB2B|nr:hypothetical protein [Uliginosibacterium sp. 31-16]MDP5239340.1 hypothetical protein [Uliginosibacterium sp. 31-16]
MRPVRTLIACLLAALALPGCSQFLYETGIATQKSRCEQQAPGAREECLQRITRQSYADYEKTRTQSPARPVTPAGSADSSPGSVVLRPPETTTRDQGTTR